MRNPTTVDDGRVLAICEAGPRVGYGHVMRTVACAAQLCEFGWEAEVAVRGPPRAISVARRVSRIEGGPAVTPASALRRIPPGRILLDTRDSSAIVRRLPSGSRVAAFDDAGRDLAVDVIINGNVFASVEMYRRSGEAVALCGPRYLSLRKGFRNRRGAVPPPGGAPRAIVALGGGANPQSVAVQKALEARGFNATLLPGFHAGSGIPPRRALHPWDLMAGKDIAVIGGGSVAYEAACLGVPAVSCPTVPGQVRNAKALEERGTLVVAGPASRRSPGDVARLCAEIVQDVARCRRMRRAGRELVDGTGAVRVARVLDRTFG